jgi:hypothetical protein
MDDEEVTEIRIGFGVGRRGTIVGTTDPSMKNGQLVDDDTVVDITGYLTETERAYFCIFHVGAHLEGEDMMQRESDQLKAALRLLGCNGDGLRDLLSRCKDAVIREEATKGAEAVLDGQ